MSDVGFSKAALLQEAEWRRCEADEDYFVERYWSVSTPDRGRILMDMSDRPYQRQGLALFRNPEHRKIITLKSRQVGWTTLCAVHSFWEAFFHPDQYVLFISRREEDAKFILRKADYGYRWLPDWMKERGPNRTDSTGQRMTFDNDSVIRSEPSQSDPARGQTATLIIADEFASLQDQEEAWASMEPVADLGGRIFLLSTAKGMGDLFSAMWQGATTGRNGFHPVFIPWSAVPMRDDQWYDEKVNSLLPWIRAQEYPSNPEEAFIQSGAMVFDLETLRAMERGVAQTRWHEVTEDYLLAETDQVVKPRARAAHKTVLV
jgi:hypothetical protein